VSVVLSKILYMYMCPIRNDLRDRAISMHSSKIVDKKGTLSTVSNTGIAQVTKLVQFTYYDTFSKIPLSILIHFATRVRTWHVARLRASEPSFVREII
jgi:hypothetical protein